MISGYFISTLDGRSIPFFCLIDVPSLFTQKGLEETAGKFHWILAYATIGLAVLHAAIALWHHFVKRDPTLVRMIKPNHPQLGEDND
jgi:cytochrome b561